MTSKHHLLPRLYFPYSIIGGQATPLSEEQSHYLHHVLRSVKGDKLRIFNAENGEWISAITDILKKTCIVTPEEQIAPPKTDDYELHLFFSPLKKERMDMLIEKSVELGVTHLHPVLFSRTIVREIKPDRITAQMIEASEQCERLTLPKLFPLLDLRKSFADWDKQDKIYAAIERHEAQSLGKISNTGKKLGLLIGPEGGISEEEIEALIKHDFIIPASLGSRILRAETAAIYGLSLLSSKIQT